MNERIILLVDDVPQTLGPLCETLEADGYTVLVAESGAEALIRIDLAPPDAILLDALMPALDGFETCRRIRANPAWQHIPIVFMTGLADTERIVEGFEAGGVDYVTKPIRIPEVRARLATHLRNARAVRLAREALDIGGHGIVVTDAHGRVAWQSPAAARSIADFGIADAVADRLQAAGPTTGLLALGTRRETSLTAERLGEVGLGETMWMLSEQRVDGPPPARVADASLTPRETEVLSWIAKGKTNRDIGDILGMSPRTVNKHLERVYCKLGVETRAAAAALASREWS